MISFNVLSAQYIPEKMEPYCFPLTRMATEKFSQPTLSLTNLERVTQNIYEYSVKAFAMLADLFILVTGLVLYVGVEAYSCITEIYNKKFGDHKSQEMESIPSRPSISLDDLKPSVPEPVESPGPSAPLASIDLPPPPQSFAEPSRPELPPKPPTVDEVDPQPSTPAVLPSAPSMDMVPPLTQKFDSDSAFLRDAFRDYSSSPISEEGKVCDFLEDLVDGMPEIFQPFAELTVENWLRMDHFSDNYLPNYLQKYLEPSVRPLYNDYNGLSKAERQSIQAAVINQDTSAITTSAAAKVLKNLRAVASELMQDSNYVGAFDTFRKTII